MREEKTVHVAEWGRIIQKWICRLYGVPMVLCCGCRCHCLHFRMLSVLLRSHDESLFFGRFKVLADDDDDGHVAPNPNTKGDVSVIPTSQKGDVFNGSALEDGLHVIVDGVNGETIAKEGHYDDNVTLDDARNNDHSGTFHLESSKSVGRFDVDRAHSASFNEYESVKKAHALDHGDGVKGSPNQVIKNNGSLIIGAELQIDIKKAPLQKDLKEQDVPFLDLLRKVVSEKIHEEFVTWHNDKGVASDSRTFGELWDEAGVISYYLRKKWKVEKGQRVVLCYDFGLHFFAVFLGCLRAGVIAVLVYPPSRPLVKALEKLSTVVIDCSPALIITDSKVDALRLMDRRNPASKSRKLWPVDVDFKTTDKLSKRRASVFDESTSLPSDLAFLQYTSGSTGDPKGVMVNFDQLLANIRITHSACHKCYLETGGIPKPITAFSWLPPYHDMGLITALLSSFSGGWRLHMMSPITFIQNPLLWLDLMSRHRVNWGIAPDFAYRLVTRKFQEAKARGAGRNPIGDLDLSCIRVLSNAAEPVRLDTCEIFGSVFAEYGLRDDWFVACYGLAEHVASCCYVHGFHQSVPRHENVSSLVAVASRLTISAVTTSILKVVCPNTHKEVNDGETGELWISGTSVAAGYFGKPGLSEEVFHAKLADSAIQVGFLRTGDLAFFQNEHLFICGRIKDLIISNGVNYYPQDIEAAVQDASPAVRPGCVAAFSSNELSSDGILEIVFEIRQSSENDAADVIQAVRLNVHRKVGLSCSRIVAIRERAIPKTTSGKIQRRATRAALHAGRLQGFVDTWLDSTVKSHRDTTTQSELGAAHEQTTGTPQPHDTFLSHSEQRQLAQSQPDSDVLVVGAGIVGLFFAHDVASLGYKVTVMERSDQIGGIWVINDYSGLRLHQPAFSYRCVSLAPKWTTEHDRKEFYRPNRDEILEYCRELASHENITVLLNTKCRFDEKEDRQGLVVCPFGDGDSKHSSRFLFVSVGSTVNSSGRPTTPFHIQENPLLNSYRPLCVHSSQIRSSVAEAIANRSGRVVVVGSGKASIDVLQTLEPSDSVVWAHRGHTVFFDRTIFQTKGEHVVRELNRLVDQKWPKGSWDNDIFVRCKGPLTKRDVKLGLGVCDKIEIARADTFHQYNLQHVEAMNDGTIKLTSDTEQDLVLTDGDVIILCTGQRNTDWQVPILEQNMACSGPFSMSAGQHHLLPCYACVQHLRGYSVSGLLNAAEVNSVGENLSDAREITTTMLTVLNKNLRQVFTNVSVDVSLCHQWQGVWYGKNVAVDKAFEALGARPNQKKVEQLSDRSSSLDGITKEFPREKPGATNSGDADFDSVLINFIGGEYDPDKTWDELGISSMSSVELRNAITASFAVVLPHDCFLLYETPAALKSHILETQGDSFPTTLPSLPRLESITISWLLMGVIQSIGVVILLGLFAATIVAAYYFAVFVIVDGTTEGFSLKWLLLPLVVPCWMLTFSLMAILAKWIVIGRYRECELAIPSTAFLRWWWIDRVVHLWEFWVGQFVANTPLIWFFYRLMGAQISPSVELGGWAIREFDLVKIGEGVSFESDLLCRKFGPWEEEEGPTLRFRSVSVAKNSVVRGILFPGVCVGENSFVERRSVVSEGAEIPSGTLATGNPAFNAGSAPQRSPGWCWWKLGGLKIVWLLAELYVSFGLLGIGYALLKNRLPRDWRYTPLCLVLLLMLLFSIFSIVVNIILKWIVIGRRQPGFYRDSMLRTAADWMVDHHFRLSILLPFFVSSNSRIWNVILMLYGADIDIVSRINVDGFSASMLDLIRIRRSFVSKCTFHTKQNGAFHRTEVDESSIGLSAVVNPGLRISRTVVVPLFHVKESIEGESLDARGSPIHPLTSLLQEMTINLLYLVLMATLFVGLLPAYELWKVLKPSSVYIIPVLAMTMAVQTLSWVLILFLFQLALYGRSPKRTSPWSSSLFAVYITACWNIQVTSFLPALWGTPLFNAAARLLGSTIGGRVLYFGLPIFDFPYITVAEKTILDCVAIIGHYVVYREITVGHTIVSGVLHQGTVGLPNSVVSGKESGPWRVYVESADRKDHDVENPEMIQKAIDAIEAFELSLVETNGITHRVASVKGYAPRRSCRSTSGVRQAPLVMLLHGWPESWYSWRHQLLFLATAGYAVCAPDMRGYGGTDSPAQAQEYTVDKLCMDVLGIARCLGYSQIVVIGHDFGAFLAWRMALLHPNEVVAVCGMSVPYVVQHDPPLTHLQRKFGNSLPNTPYRASRQDQQQAQFHYILHHNLPHIEEEYDLHCEESLYRIYFFKHGVECNPSEVTDKRMFPPEYLNQELDNALDARSAPGLWARLPRPKSLPTWMTSIDFDYFVRQYHINGFAGGLKWYQALDISWHKMPDLSMRKIEQPAMFLCGAKDPCLDEYGGEENVVREMKKNCHTLMKYLILPDTGHCIQQERQKEVCSALLEFLLLVRSQEDNSTIQSVKTLKS